jgi:hypothetical protein
MSLTIGSVSGEGAVAGPEAKSRRESGRAGAGGDGVWIPGGGGVGTCRVFRAVLSLSQRRTPPMGLPERR